jgi:hypothetical protein
MKNSEIFAFSVYDYIFRYWFYGRLPYAVIRWNQPYICMYSYKYRYSFNFGAATTRISIEAWNAREKDY